MSAREISAIQPLLKENDVRLIGVGFEPLGIEMFMKLKYFDGDVFVDEGRKSYNALDFKRMSFADGISALVSSAARAAKATARALGLSSNKVGDMFQNGGCLVVEKGGGNSPLLHFVQNGPAERVSNVEVLKVLGIDGEVPPTAPIVEVVEPHFNENQVTWY